MANAPSLLLISAQEPDRVFAEAAAAGAGMPLLVADRSETAAPLVVHENVGAIFIDVSNGRQFLEFDNYLADLQTLYARKLNADRVHLIASPDQLRRIAHYLGHPLLGNLILRRYGDPVAAGTQYARTLAPRRPAAHEATTSTLETNDANLGLRRLGFAANQVEHTQFRGTGEKGAAIRRVSSFLTGLGCAEQVTEAVANAADELILNAIFDAPVNEKGERIFRDVPRSTELTLAPGHRVSMQLGYDGEYLGISVIDSAGSLDRKRVLSQITRLFRTKHQKLNEDGAGAGVGISMIFRSGASFFFVAEPNSRTEVNVLFRRTRGFREFRSQFQFISSWVK